MARSRSRTVTSWFHGKMRKASFGSNGGRKAAR